MVRGIKSRAANLALLVAVGQYLQTVGGDGQELDVVVRQQRDHLLQTTGEVDSHLCTILVQQKVV